MILFKPWRAFKASLDPVAIPRFLRSVAKESKAAFVKGMNEPKTGRWYSGKPRRSSAPGEYPAVQSGRLLKSAGTRVTSDSATVGTNTYYAKWLREGTRRMQRRKMSTEALREGVEASRPLLKGVIGFRRGNP